MCRMARGSPRVWRVFFLQYRGSAAFWRPAKFRCRTSDFDAARRAWDLSNMRLSDSKRRVSSNTVMPGLPPDIPLRRARCPIRRDGRDFRREDGASRLSPGHDGVNQLSNAPLASLEVEMNSEASIFLPPSG